MERFNENKRIGELIMISKERFNNIDTGDVLIFTPDFNGDSNFNTSDVADTMKEHNADKLIIELTEGQYGLKNTFTYEVSFQREDGSFVTEGEIRNPDFVTDETRDNKAIDKLYQMMFLGYLSNYLEFMKIKKVNK